FGVKTVDAIDSENFRIDLGIPTLPNSDEPVLLAPNTDIIETLRVGGRRFPYFPLAFARKFAVVVTEKQLRAIKNLAVALADHETLTEYQPVFLKAISQDECWAYAWAKDSTPDHTGSMAAAAAVGILNGFCNNEVSVRYRSSLLYVQWQRHDNRVYITAPADYICSGSYYVDDEILEKMRAAREVME
ncbi:MAG: hypothetical protein HN368_00775, partial [Spirochaetales bacterium]|nr:hypothetical protein [Spirochaetales bacterium]